MGVPSVEGQTGESPATATVLVTVDSLRADVVHSSIAEATPLTPSIDQLGNRGTEFDHAFAAGNWTPFSFPSLLGATPVFTDGPSLGVGSPPTLAETLAAEDVTTIGLNAANGFLTEHWAYDRGFDRFESYLGDDRRLSSRYLRAHPTVQAWLRLAAAPFRRLNDRLRNRGTAHQHYPNASHMRDLEADAIAAIETTEPPFFLWVHYMDTHTPYIPAPKHVRAVTGDTLGHTRMLRTHARTGLGLEVDDRRLADLRTLYRATVRQVDASIGRIMEALAAAGIRDETCVILTGDHGEEFQEHGHLAHYPKLYRELIHVPLIVDHPAETPPRIERAVSLDSIPATVCRAMGIDPADRFARAGLFRSMHPAETGGRPAVSVTVRGDRVTRQPIPRELTDGELLVSARTDRWTYIEYTDTGRRELYDRLSDPNEQVNRWPDAPAAPIERLQAAVDRRLAQIDSTPESDASRDGPDTPETTPTDAITDQLKALGYR